MALCATWKSMKIDSRRSAGGSPVSWVEDREKSTAGPAALQRFSQESSWRAAPPESDENGSEFTL